VTGLGGELVLAFEDGAEWEAWLHAHHAATQGVWLKIAKRGSGLRSIANADALDVALCYGWINGQRRSLDNRHYLQRYTPRRPRSTWSRINVDRVDELIREGRMREPGMAEVEAAKADGRWDAAYEPASTATVPPDLEAALDANPRAKRFYDSLGRTDRYLAILRLSTATTERARAARLERILESLADGKRIT